MKVIKRRVLIDSGELVKPEFAKGTKLHIPDICQHINSIGTIIYVAPKCIIISQEDIGKKCIVAVEHHEDYRVHPLVCERYGLNKTWHYRIPEDCIHALIE